MNYVVDTHYLVWYIVGRLPKKIDNLFKQVEQGQSTVFVPTIVLAEILYLIKNHKIILNYSDLIRKIEISDNIVPIPLDISILKLLPEIDLSEIHDQIVVATAKLVNAKLITKDREIIESNIIECIS